MIDPTQHFSTRVENYIKYRPSYPDAIIDLLATECNLTPTTVIADIGSGTGILADVFLRYGFQVYGIEPNDAMRTAGETLLDSYARFTSVAATAEDTTLPDHSVDMITAGQAYHWFDPERARVDWRRILRPNGWMVLIWNTRYTGGTPFLEAYEQLLRTYGTDYTTVAHQNIDHGEERRAFFGGDTFKLATFDNRQILDWEGLRGRVFSSSYTPELDHPNYEPMLRELRTIFDHYKEDGAVTFLYTTEVWYGQFA